MRNDRWILPKQAKRRGATAVEAAIVLPVLFAVLFAILDLGIAATRYNAIAEVAHRVAREAVLHGSLSEDSADMWGPSEYSGTLADGSFPGVYGLLVAAAAEGLEAVAAQIGCALGGLFLEAADLAFGHEEQPFSGGAAAFGVVAAAGPVG